MSNDCGCTKKVVDKIYIENSCCDKSKKQDKCNSKQCCTSCGKQIDLIDSDLYADNIYNYQENTAFNAKLVIILEGELKDPNTDIKKEDVYETLSTVDNKTEVLVQLMNRNNFLGLNCIASFRKQPVNNESDKFTYILAYVKEYEDDSINKEGKTDKIRRLFCIYTNNYDEASYRQIDITSYTCDEILSILEQYCTNEFLQNYYYSSEYIDNHFYTSEYIDNNYFTNEYITNNYYDQTYIDNLNLGEKCLFEMGEIDQEDDHANEWVSTQRKNDGSKANGYKSFAIQGGIANGEHSIAIGKDEGGNASTASGNYSIALSGGHAKKYSIAFNGNAYAEDSIAFKGISNSVKSISLGNNSYCGEIKDNTSYVSQECKDTLNEKCALSLTNSHSSNIAINGGKSSGESSIAIGSSKGSIFGYANATNTGSLAIGQNVYSGGEFSFVFGQSSEAGRYRDNTGYVYSDQEGSKIGSLGSVVNGNYISVDGAFNAAFGERHFIKEGNNNFVIGNGQSINEGYENFLFGHRNIVENCNNNIAGGEYSQVGNSSGGGLTQGAISIGDAFDVLNIYIKYKGSFNAGTSTYYNYDLYYKLGSQYIQLNNNTEFGKLLLDSNVSLRNGKKGFLITLNFNYTLGYNGKKMYPSIENLEADLPSDSKIGPLYITIEKNYHDFILSNSDNIINDNDYYKCFIKCSKKGNICNGSGSVCLGIGNKTDAVCAAAIGKYNKSDIDSQFACGKYNYSGASEDENPLFVVGNGSYSPESYLITRQNILEVTERDIYVNLPLGLNSENPNEIKRFSLTKLLTELVDIIRDKYPNSSDFLNAINAQLVLSQEEHLMSVQSSTQINNPLYVNGFTDLGDGHWFIRLKDNNGQDTLSVYDPTGSLETCNPDGDLS